MQHAVSYELTLFKRICLLLSLKRKQCVPGNPLVKGTDLKILLVDRSKSWRFVQQRCFRGLGIREVVAVEQESEAWEQFQNHEFDIVFVDINWSNLSSLELISQIRGARSNVPVILLTSEADRCHLVTAINAGITDYLVKPCSPETIQNKLSKWLGCLV